MARSYSHPVSILHEPRPKILRSSVGVGEGNRLARNASSLIRCESNLGLVGCGPFFFLENKKRVKKQDGIMTLRLSLVIGREAAEVRLHHDQVDGLRLATNIEIKRID